MNDDVTWNDKGNTHSASLPIGEIGAAIAAKRQGYRINGVWVQYHGDGTERARKGEVVVSVQYGWPGAALAVDGRGPTVREAGYDAIRSLTDAVRPPEPDTLTEDATPTERALTAKEGERPENETLEDMGFAKGQPW